MISMEEKEKITSRVVKVQMICTVILATMRSMAEMEMMNCGADKETIF